MALAGEKVKWVWPVILLWITPILLAQDRQSDLDFSEFSLEDLFKIEIVTASKLEEPLWEAPGVVTVVTATEIERFGGANLYEVLGRVPGVQTSFTIGQNRTSLRGGSPLFTFGRILLLVDGRPIRSPGATIGINYNPIEAFPLSRIQRIEIVRGPGSVLYGTDAFEGVINIITKKGPATDRFQVATRLGSNNGKGAEASVTLGTEEFGFDAGVTHYDQDGWIFDSNDQLNPEETLSKRVFEDRLGFSSTLRYKNLTFSSYLARVKQFSMIPVITQNDPLSLHSKVVSFDLGYDWTLNPNWKIRSDVTFNREVFDFMLGGPLVNWDQDSTLVEVTAFGNLGNNLNLVAGAVLDNWTGNAPSVGIAEYDLSLWSSYAQLNYRANRYLKIIAGGQFNKVENISGDFVPRIGAIISFNPQSGMKLLYGEAFRSPKPIETQVDFPSGNLGNPSLSPETIESFDLQIFFKTERVQSSFNYYRNTEKDLIGLVELENSPYLNTFRNTGSLDLDGFEFEAKFLPTPHWYLLGAWTYQQNEDGNGVEDTSLIPNTSVKVGVAFSRSRFSASVFDTYHSAYHDTSVVNPAIASALLPGRALLNPAPEATHWVTANFTLNLQDLWDLPNSVRFQIEAKNLLDEDVYVPEYLFSNVNSIPGAAGRTFQATCKFKF